MFVIRVQNKSSVTVNVPLSSLVPGAQQVAEQAQPDAWASCVFAPPTSSFEAQNAVVAWAEAAGIDITVAIEPAPLPSQSTEPGPVTTVNPANPLGL
jgi:hypothetical protein